MQWFRLHNKLLNDPVVQGLSDKQFKVYINLLCHASLVDKNGLIGTINETSFALRETKEIVSSCFMAFQEVGLLVTSETDSETFHIPQWRKKQYKSDTSTDRVRKHRENKKRFKAVTVTPPDTDTDTDTDTDNIDKTKAKRFAAPSIDECKDYFVEKGSTHLEAQKFFDYYESNGWKVGKNKMKKWKSSASGWISRQSNFVQPNKPNQASSNVDDFLNYGEEDYFNQQGDFIDGECS